MDDLLTELEALAYAIDYEWDGDNNMHDAAACIRTLIAAEKARGPDPLLVQVREALEGMQKLLFVARPAATQNAACEVWEHSRAELLESKVPAAIAALDARLGRKA